MTQVRAARPDDADAVAAIYRPEVLHGVATFEIEPPDVATMRARMAGEDGRYPWLVATVDDAVVGYACGARFHPREAYRLTVETGVYVAERAQGTGVGRALYAALIDTLTAAGFAQAIARVSLPNPGSVRLHEAAGFRAGGVMRAVGRKHGRWIDVGWWQRALAAPDLADPHPR